MAERNMGLPKGNSTFNQLKKTFFLISFLLSLLTSEAQQNRSPEKGKQPGSPELLTGSLVRKINSLRNYQWSSDPDKPASRTMNGILFKKPFKEEIRDFGSIKRVTPAKQSSDLRIGSVITSNTDGSGFTSVVPADPTIAVSPNHILQMVNGQQGAYLRILDKTANEILPRIYMHQLLNAPTYFGYGDPVVLFDQFSNRFFISEFASDSCNGCYPNTLMIGVSANADPTGAWNFYKFKSGNFLVDYPKFAAWPNALYATSNDFNTSGTNYLGSSIYAFDKTAMLNGAATTTIQRFRLRSSQYNKFLSLAPVNISGNNPPSSSEGLFMYFHDDNRTASLTDADSLGIIKLSPDFNNSSNTSFEYLQQIPVAPFKSSVCNGSRNCVSSGAGAGYDEISDRIMQRIQYRNFGTHESIVLNHTVDANYPLNDPKAGIRWYELRRTNSDWIVYQQSTFSPDADGRFMGSININSKGQIALAYNLSGPGKFASIFFTGRNADDPLNQMIYNETMLKEGSDFGTQGSRWGDYSDLSVDPVNDSIFWFSGMYGSTNWQTRISSFKFQSIPKREARLVAVLYPTENSTSCDNTIQPKIVIQSNGSLPLTLLTIKTNVDGQTKSSIPWTGSLNLSGSDTLLLPSITLDTGTHEIEFMIDLLDEDGDKTNNTIKQFFTVLYPFEKDIQENFEQETFPPAQWSIYNYVSSTQSFRRTNLAGYKSNSSAVMRNFSNVLIGDIDVLASPVINTNVDSIILEFDLAYKVYGASPSFADTLQVVISNDCGNSFQTVWERSGVNLATSKGNITSDYIPFAADWKKIKLNLKPFAINGSNMMIGFRSKGKYGQNLYIDNVHIQRKVLPDSALLINRIISPTSQSCTNEISPVIEVSNRGRKTINAYTVLLRKDGIITDSIVINESLAPGANKLVTFKNISLSQSDSTTISFETTNDTASIKTYLNDVVRDELKEGFEGLSFPPANWTESSVNEYNWESTDLASASGNRSALIRNYMSNVDGRKDRLFSPPIMISKFDSVYLAFDYAYPANQDATDTLEIRITEPCSLQGASVFKKWGRELATSTMEPPLYSRTDTIGFIPQHPDWKRIIINITEQVKMQKTFQIILENSADKGHNLYLDNLHVYGVNLPRRLKEQGYLVFPVPTNGLLTIRHLEDPKDLRQIELINSLGQVLLKNAYNGNAQRTLQIDLSGRSSGIYHLRMTYTGKVITERIIKSK